MSSTIEDRLVAALDARAELVTPQHLRPLEVPGTPRRHTRTGVLLLAAAATVAIVGAPLVLQDESGKAPAPEPVAPPSAHVSEPTEPTPSDGPSAPSDAVVLDRQQADVDGDGRPDQVRLLLHSANREDPAEGTVEVSLAAGGTGIADVPFGYPGLKPAFAIDGDGREQILVTHTQGGDSATLLVYTWHDGGLVLTGLEGDAPLGLEQAGDGQLLGYYTGDRGLVSWRRLGAVEPGSSVYQVEEWSWSVEGDRLVPTPVGKSCFDVTEDAPPQPC